MHEYSIVASLIDRVEHEVQAHCGSKVQKLRVKIGELSGVEVDLLRTAFETFRERTICEGAQLEIDAIDAVWACTRCDRRIPRGAVLRCHDCSRPATLVRGDEIVLERIEMEVADV
ncbi:MAG: hydrogenase maturation nickel metallochaperone HypA [Myxococcota bacterium]